MWSDSPLRSSSRALCKDRNMEVCFSSKKTFSTDSPLKSLLLPLGSCCPGLHLPDRGLDPLNFLLVRPPPLGHLSEVHRLLLSLGGLLGGLAEINLALLHKLIGKETGVAKVSSVKPKCFPTWKCLSLRSCNSCSLPASVALSSFVSCSSQRLYSSRIPSTVLCSSEIRRSLDSFVSMLLFCGCSCSLAASILPSFTRVPMTGVRSSWKHDGARCELIWHFPQLLRLTPRPL